MHKTHRTPRRLLLLCATALAWLPATALAEDGEKAKAFVWKDDWHLALILLGVILVAGLFGGLVRRFYDTPKPDDEEEAPEPMSWPASIVTGAGAALLVPAFLFLTSSDLIATTLSGDRGVEGWFVLFGFCLAAGGLGRVFIDAVTGKLLSQLQRKVDDQGAQLEELGARLTVFDLRVKEFDGSKPEAQGPPAPTDELNP
jgi:hypothetical protein